MSTSCIDSVFQATGEKSPNIVFYKVCLVGNSGVGKTTLFMRLKTGRYIDASQATLTEDTYRYTHIVDDDIEVSMQIHDTCGYEKVSTLSPNYFRGALAVVLMFSVEELSTLYQLQAQVDEAKTYAHSLCFYILVGNKTDLLMEVDKPKVMQFKELLECKSVVYISAKEGENIQELLDVLSIHLNDICQQDNSIKNVLTLSNPLETTNIRSAKRQTKSFKC